MKDNNDSISQQSERGKIKLVVSKDMSGGSY
jgi:hypothetical protein